MFLELQNKTLFNADEKRWEKFEITENTKRN